MNSKDHYLDAVRNLNVNRQGDRRAPHKPLLLLVAISKLLAGERELPFPDAEALLQPLLSAYAPPVKARHQPALPYWHLRNDRLWEIPGASDIPRQAGNFPQMQALRSSSGHLEKGFAEALESDHQFLLKTVGILLAEHFPESIHSDILTAVGLNVRQQDTVGIVPQSGIAAANEIRTFVKMYSAHTSIAALSLASVQPWADNTSGARQLTYDGMRTMGQIVQTTALPSSPHCTSCLMRVHGALLMIDAYWFQHTSRVPTMQWTAYVACTVSHSRHRYQVKPRSQ